MRRNLAIGAAAFVGGACAATGAAWLYWRFVVVPGVHQRALDAANNGNAIGYLVGTSSADTRAATFSQWIGWHS